MSDNDIESGIEERPELDEKLSELAILKQSLDDARTKEKGTYDQLLRLGAEFENFRKRSEARAGDSRRFGKEDVLLQLMPLTDALAQAMSGLEKATDIKAFKEGMTLLSQQFEKFLKDQGLVEIKSLGQKLDPHLHEAIAQEENADVEDGTIIGEIQKGYTLNDRVVRPARVTVATNPAAAAQNLGGNSNG